MVDALDKKILFELDWNCRQTYSALGKKLHVSKQVVSYRISQLERKGIIESYHALIDWRRLGYNAIRVYLKWHGISPAKEQEIYDHLKEDPLFMWTVKFEGEFDVGFYVWIDSLPDFANKWYAFLQTYREYILKQEICESIHMVHYPMKPLAGMRRGEERIIGNEGKSEYDETDYEILKMVTQNARMPIVDIAKRIALTSRATIYRMRKLEKNKIILGYNALIDTNKLGYSFYKVDFYLNSLSLAQEMFEYAKMHDNIIYRMRTIGGPDFEIEVMVRDANELHNLIGEVRERFAQSIEFHRLHRFERTIKHVYLPGQTRESRRVN